MGCKLAQHAAKYAGKCFGFFSAVALEPANRRTGEPDARAVQAAYTLAWTRATGTRRRLRSA